MYQIGPYRTLFRSPLAAVAGVGTDFTFIAGITAASPDGSTFSTGAIDTTGAGLLIIGLADYEAVFPTLPTITDSKGNSWNRLTEARNTATVLATIYYSVPASVGSGHTVTATETGFYGALTFAAFGLGAATPFDVENVGTGTSANPSASTGITPTVDNELVIANVGIDSGTISSINGGFTIIGSPVAYGGGTNFGCAMAYLIQTTATAADPDWTNSGSANWAANIASFKVS